MAKRVTSFVLALVMVLLCLPTLVLPATAAASPTSSSTEPIYIRFRLGDQRGYGYIGTVVKETVMTGPGIASITYPTDDTLLSYGIKPSDVLGWYVMKLDGTVIDASAYNGVYISEDLNFYPYLKSSSMGFNTPANSPIIAELNTTNKVLALRNGWTAGAYRDGAFWAFDHAPSPGLVFETGTSAWGDGSAYYQAGGGGNAMVLSKNANRVLGLSWTAIASGTVNVNLDKLTLRSDGPADDKPIDATTYVVITKNGQVIWPTSIAGQSMVTTGFADAGWYKASAGNTTALAAHTNVSVGAALSGVSVAAGDTICFYFGYSNTRIVDCNPNVAYTQVNALSEDIIYTLPYAYEPARPLDIGQKPITGAASDTDPEVSYPGNWEMIVYDNAAAIANSENGLPATYYTKSDSTKDAFFTSKKDYGSADASPAAFVYGLGAGWGVDYSIAIQSNGGHRAAAGFRYTAEHAGYLQASFEAFKRCAIGWEMAAAGYNDLRFAIFVDGVMVWPTVGGAATDYNNWYKPYTVPSDYKLATSAAPNPTLADMTEEINAALEKEKFFVQQGSRVDFLITYGATGVSIWQGAANVMLPAVDYTDIFVTNFSASAALGSSLALNFTADANTASFVPNENKPYLLADTVNLSLSGGAEGMVIGTPTVENGKLTAKVSNITAKQMTEAVDYVFTADVRNPGGTIEKLTLGEGSISVASYMKALYHATTDIGIRDLALATLQYGAAAQTFFGYKTNVLATAELSGNVSFTLDAAVDKVAQGGQGDYYFSGATVLLEDTLQLKLLLDATNGARDDWNDLYLAINGKKTNATVSLRANNKDGTYLKAILDIPFAEFATDLSITLHTADGTQVSTTLTYSVETYAARTANAGQADILTAIRTVGKAALNYKEMTSPTEDGEIVTRLVFLSDSHIGETTTQASQKLTAQLAKIKEWNQTTPVDAIVFPGDMTNLGINSEYQELIRILTEAGLPDTIDLSFAQGNHEFSVTVDSNGDKGSYTDKPSAESIALSFEIFNKYHSDVYHVNGEGESKYTVSEDGMDHSLRLEDGTYLIGLSMRGGGVTYGEKTEQFLLQEVAKAVAEDPTKPILIYNHIGYGEIKGSSKWTPSAETSAILDSYPQIVWLTGHTHYALQDPAMIQQKNFTNIQLPTAGSKWWWVYSAGYTSPASYAYEANQGLILTISDTNVIYAERYDFGTNETIGEKWRIDIPAILRSKANFTYQLADRMIQAKAPEFAANAEIAVDKIGTTSAQIITPMATINDAVSDNAVEYYAIIVTDMEGNVAFTQKKLSEYYRASRANATMTFDASGLKPGTEYKVYVRADSIFGKSSESLIATFTTEESKNPREYLTELLNVDYSTGIADDRKGHAVKTIGTPTLANGRATFAGNSAYQYTLTGSDKAAMAGTLTLETVLKVNSYFKASEATESWGTYDALVSNVEAGGFGLNYYHKSGSVSKLEFVTYSGTADNRTTVNVQADVPLKEEIHVIATVGGGYVTLYVDGVKVAEKAFVGNIVHSTATNPHYLLVGANTNGWGGFQCSSACSVKYVRLYSENVGADEATLLYRQAAGIVTLPELTDILDVDYSTGSAADAKGHALKTLTDGSEGAGPVFKDGKAVFDCKSAYQYMLTAADKLAMASSLTLETTLSIDATPDNATLNWGYGSLISNVEAGGFGLKYTYSGGVTRLDFFSYTGTTNENKVDVVVSASVALKDEIHVVATIGNGYISLYIDGVLVATKAFAGNIFHSVATQPHTLLVGGDPNGYGGLQYPAYCSVKNVHLYAEGVTAEDVRAMYANATGTEKLVSLDQLLKIDFSGSYADAYGHEAAQRGNPVIADGKATMTGDAFGYKLGDEEYAKVLQTMTLEMVVTIDSEYSKNGANALFANQNGGGFGLLYIPSGYSNAALQESLYFEFHVGGSYKNIHCPVEIGQKMHIVVTFDGVVANLYINGQLMASLKASGAIRDHGPNTVYVGADYGSGADNATTANLQNYANATYDTVNLYADAADYDQVQTMYQAAMGEGE